MHTAQDILWWVLFLYHIHKFYWKFGEGDFEIEFDCINMVAVTFN